MSDRIKPESTQSDIDLLADIVAHSHVATFYERCWYAGPWNLQFEAGDLRGFHVVTHGSASIRASDGTEYELIEGDVILMSTPHQLATDLDETPFEFSPEVPIPFVSSEEDGEVCMLCGAYQFSDAASHPVFANLPDAILLRRGARDPAVDRVIELLEIEFSSNAPGGRTIAHRLVDTLLIYILRHFIEHSCPSQLGWLSALRDPILARALALMHNEYDEDWTLETLARRSGTSRASLARHFSAEVGTTPIQYLTERRLDAARRLLSSTTMSLDEIAGEVGYASAFSLSKAFKRHYGEAPTHYVRSA